MSLYIYIDEMYLFNYQSITNIAIFVVYFLAVSMNSVHMCVNVKLSRVINNAFLGISP
jgi:hypothetical protein